MSTTSDLAKIHHECNGILHIGANNGGEAAFYSKLNKPVLWIEADPNIYSELEKNISKYTNQKCINALITDKDDEKYTFQVASNNGGSSSIFEFDDYVHVLFPKYNLKMVKTLELVSTTLDSLAQNNDIPIHQYDLLVIDIQGAELLAFKGANNYIENYCRYIYTEVSTKQIYIGGALYEDLKQYLSLKNFIPTSDPLSEHTNVLFKKSERN